MKILDSFCFWKTKTNTSFPLTLSFEEQLTFLNNSVISYLHGDIKPEEMEKIIEGSAMLPHTTQELIEFGIDLQIRTIIEHGTMSAALNTGQAVFANFEPILNVGFKKSKQNIDRLLKKGILRPDFTQYIHPSYIRGVFAQDRILAGITEYRRVNSLWLDPTASNDGLFFNQLILTGTTDIIFTDKDLIRAFRDLMTISIILATSDEGEPNFEPLAAITDKEHVENFKKLVENATLDNAQLKERFIRHLMLPITNPES